VRDLDELFRALAKSRFRSRQRLDRKDRAYLQSKSLSVLLEHADRFVRRRLAPADPTGDGRQTPMRGHPVFVAQHATATCCRGCLARWHKIAAHRPLTDPQIVYVLAVIRRWLIEQGAEEKPLPLFPEQLRPGRDGRRWPR